MVIVIDCNVLVAAARSDGVCRKVIVEALHRHRVVVSDVILEEYAGGAERRKHADYRGAMLKLIAELRRKAIAVEPDKETFGLRDPDDEVYLATAKAGRAVLVTGNARDFAASRYGPVDVLSPRAFLDRSA